MQKLTETDRQQAFDYVMQEPEFNLFIIGDLENFGFENENVEIFANEVRGNYDCLLLRYMDNYIIYSHHLAYDAEKVATFLSGKEINCINGKGDIVEKLLPYFPDRFVENTYMSRLNKVMVQQNTPANVEVRRLQPENAADIISLYLEIEEFRDNYSDDVKKGVKEVRFNLENGGRSYGTYLNGKLMSVASTTAENSVSAMVVGVATLPNTRKMGLASSLVAKICKDFLCEGKQFLCLFYDNPAAGSIYRKIGFTELGNYIMLKKKKQQL